MQTQTSPPNPVVKETALRAYPGWTIREYADGTYDAQSAVALSPVEASWEDALHFVRNGTPRVRAPRSARAGNVYAETKNARPVPDSLQASFSALSEYSFPGCGEWGVKLNAVHAPANAKATGYAGCRAVIITRAGKRKEVVLGRQLSQWNSGRAAVYALAGKGRS